MKTIQIPTKARTQMVNITLRIQDEVRAAGFTNGLCCVYVPHTTAGVFINEGADPSVMEDMENTLDRMVRTAIRRETLRPISKQRWSGKA